MAELAGVTFGFRPVDGKLEKLGLERSSPLGEAALFSGGRSSVMVDALRERPR